MTQAVHIYNRKARHDYFIESTIECGVELKGNEVKSIKSGMCNIKDAWGTVKNGEVTLTGVHITPWETSNNFDIKKDRDIKLLLHKSEIRSIKEKIEREGYTIVPIEVYENHGLIKCILGICKGKHNYDKREALKQKEVQREIQRKYV